MTGVIKVKGSIQHYAWGGKQFLPQLLALPTTNNEPFAEYWLGVHSAGEAKTVSPQALSLSQWLTRQQQQPLPYLFKILDVASMLSIQVHPTLGQAAAGFDRENAAGIALTAKHRNYKDTNDKPELMLALSEFWLLHGFKSLSSSLQSLARHACLQPLHQLLEAEGLQAVIIKALDINDLQTQAMHVSLLESLKQNGPWQKNQIEFWIARWVDTNPNTLNGILVLFFMNLVHLNEGQAIYQPPGLLHAYLEGKNAELMANSDNVLRAGLTPKHIDVDELLKISQIAPTNANHFIIKAQKVDDCERIYPTPFSGFELSEFTGRCHKQWVTKSVELLFCYQGSVMVTHAGESFTLQTGESAIVTADTPVGVVANTDCRVFRTTGSPTRQLDGHPLANGV